MTEEGRRGPPGAAPTPPAWLENASLPIDIIASTQVLHRIHRTVFEPVFFGPGRRVSPTNRFDCASGRFGVLYVALSRKAALAETILRNPQRLMVSTTEITGRSAVELACERPLRVVRMYGSGLQAVGTDNAISTGPYEPCGLWSDALWDHSDKPDGLAYQSRHDSAEICIALFERSDMRFTRIASTPLSSMLQEVAALLETYGKSLSPVIGP